MINKNKLEGFYPYEVWSRRYIELMKSNDDDSNEIW